MFKFAMGLKYYKLDMDIPKDKELYNRLLGCVDIRIISEIDTYIQPTKAIIDKQGNLVADAEPAQFIKQIKYEIIGGNVPNEFK